MRIRVKDKRLAKILRENKLDFSDGGANLSLDDAKAWINVVQPLLRALPDLHREFSYYSIYVNRATREDARIFNHLKTLQGIADQAEAIYKQGLRDEKSVSKPTSLVLEHPVIASTIAGIFVLVLWQFIKGYF
tara:strand:- start:1858 stop:2256 length:399 start_codon:yes stop_codon:yes gene_type:complete